MSLLIRATEFVCPVCMRRTVSYEYVAGEKFCSAGHRQVRMQRLQQG